MVVPLAGRIIAAVVGGLLVYHRGPQRDSHGDRAETGRQLADPVGR